MGKKKKKSRRAGSAIAPIDKQGIKLATLLTEIGLAAEAGSVARVHTGDWGESFRRFGGNLLDVSRPGTKIMVTGIALKLAGKFVPQLRNLGVVGFR
jgi:hypothetical protein